MATSADIGSGFSNYQGDPALGGGVIDAVKIDTRPIEQLAQYTLLYNKAEYDQRQRDAEKAAQEIATVTSFDLNSSIPKDAQLIRQKYDSLIEYVRQNPDAVNYRDKEKWAEFQRMKNDLRNDIASAKTRDLIKLAREKEIADETNEDLKKIMREELDAEIARTDIKTPIQHTQKYDIVVPELPVGQGVEFDVYKKGPNQDYVRDYSLFNIRKAASDANVFAVGLDQFSTNVDPGSPQARRRAAALKNNFWIQGSQTFNASIASYKDKDGNVDPTKLKGITKNLYNLIEDFNNYVTNTALEISAGNYKDDKGVLSFGDGRLDPNDYIPIDVNNGISPDELAKVAAYASWKGDTYKTKIIQTDDQNQIEARKSAERMNNADNAAANWRALIGAGGGKNPLKEGQNVMDLTGSKSSDLTIADLAAIDSSLVENENGVLKPSSVAKTTSINVLPNGDVQLTNKNGFRIVTKSAYQKNAITITQTILKDRKGEEGNPFTYTGVNSPNSSDPDTGLTDAEYYKKHGKVRQKSK